MSAVNSVEDPVIVLSVDDLSDIAKYETFLRPILQRLKRIDGHAPVSLMTTRIDPQDPAALYFAGALNSAQHNWDQAVGYLRTALVRDPINVSIYYALATALVQKGDTGEAEKVMGQFQELKSRGTGTSYGNQYLEQGRYAQAIQVSSSGQAFGSAAGRPRFVETALTLPPRVSIAVTIVSANSLTPSRRALST